MPKKQLYGIKFPISIKSGDNTLFDLNHTLASKVSSDIMHVIFTPKGQKLRDPLFGTNLIQYIFDPNDGQTWEDVIIEIKETVKKYVPFCNIIDVQVDSSDEGLGLFAKILYSVTNADGTTNTYELTTDL